jgi:hypothetical protein
MPFDVVMIKLNLSYLIWLFVIKLLTLSPRNNYHMSYSIKDKLEWTVIFIHEFGKKHGLSLKQSFNYLNRFKGIDFVDHHYDYVHTQSFQSMVADITEYCHRMGGELV